MILLTFLFRVFCVLIVIGFAALNAQKVTVDVYWYTLQAPLAQVVLVSILVGYIIKLVMPLLFFWKKKRSFLH